MDRPNFVEEKHLEYLDELRESGVTNMYGATSYLQDAFGLESNIAGQILEYWMKSFSERHFEAERKEQ